MDMINETQPLLPSSSSSSTKYPTDTETQTESDQETGTHRTLTWSSAYILTISRVIGSGIFATPGIIVKSTGSIGLTILLWIIGTILSGCGLAVSLELGCMFPRSGGDKVYLEFVYRYPRFLVSTLIAVQAVLLGFSASNCVVFARYTLFAFGLAYPGGGGDGGQETLSKGLAVGLLTFVTLLHGRFLRTGIHIQNVLGWVKIFLVIGMAFTGVWVILFRQNHHHHGHFDINNIAVNSKDTINTATLWDDLWKNSNWNYSLLSTSLFKVFYSYAGLNNVNNVLSEVRDPVRTLKTVGPAALLTACALYLLANVSYFLVVPIDEIKESGELVAALFFERVFGVNVGRRLLTLAIAVSAAGNVLVVTFALARLNQEIARQGFLPFSRTLSSSRPFNSPLGGLLVHYIPSLLVITLPPQNNVYSFILDVEGYPAQFFALAVTAGLLILRARYPHLSRPFRAWLPAVWLRIVVCLALLGAPFFPPPNQKGGFGAWYAVVGVGIILFAVIYWYIWTVLLPRWGGYSLEEAVEVLDDGTSITQLVRVYKKDNLT